MKVLDLQCSHQHSFEGWFGSEDDFQNQLARNLVQCPMCGNAEITKKLSAPRFNLGKSAARSLETAEKSKSESKTELKTASQHAATSEKDTQNAAISTELAVRSPAPNQTQQLTQRPNLPPEVAEAMQAAWLEVAKHVMANTEDVGSSFASEARKIHYGEADERAIRGQATPDQTMELLEEGIDVMPIPESLKRPLN
jgi:hypothetical protein